MFEEKLDQQIRFDASLDLSRFIRNPNERGRRFELIALCTHSGTFGGGHYRAYASRDGAWYLFDDEKVTPIKDLSEVDTRQIYLMFYRKAPLTGQAMTGMV